MPSVLVAGPPCGGKTTYVREHAPAGSVVLDFDDIVEGLTGDRYADRSPGLVAEARALWLRELPGADWVIWLAPRRSQRGRFRAQFKASSVVVMASLDECVRRAESERPASWVPVVRRWFADFEPSRNGSERLVRSDGGHSAAIAATRRDDDRKSPNA